MTGLPLFPTVLYIQQPRGRRLVNDDATIPSLVAHQSCSPTKTFHTAFVYNDAHNKYSNGIIGLQCFDTVGWASGRASGP